MANKNTAVLRYSSVAPTEEQANQIREALSKKFNNPELEMDIIKDTKVQGGFIVSYGNYEYDWSDEGRTRQLKELIALTKKRNNTSADQLVSIIRDRVNKFELKAEGKEVGRCTWVGDGIANVVGIDHAFYGEIVQFEDGTKGMVQDIRDDHVGVILFGSDVGIREGTKAVRTYKQAGIPVGEAFIGRVIDALGNPIDGGEEVKTDVYRPVEEPAPGIIERKSVNEPLETGILSIDTMFPIGRGQRELIIGDRQTGKTSIAMDAILNQKGKDVICVYVAIGQKASTIAKLINTLKEAGAMEYTIIVASTAADSAPLQYIAPYAGTAMAEYFMLTGKDVLIIYDDLSKHAVAYRALSLLLERSPGREAYPGDVFYLHSRLLERSSKLSSELGGGSITALPIIETQAGDVSAYIPTNVISITDGQIFLESDLFFEGMRPAVNVGLSVSRVGSAAQTKAMKKAAGSIRIDLAQYREMAVFTQFASDLDETTKEQLRHGSVLMELLKQPLGHPYSMAEMVILLVCANGKKLDYVPVNEVAEYKKNLLQYFKDNKQDVITDITKSGDLSDSTRKLILETADAFEELTNEKLKEELKKKRKTL